MAPNGAFAFEARSPLLLRRDLESVAAVECRGSPSIQGHGLLDWSSMGFEDGLKTIVVATDLKCRSEAALAYARKLASGYRARIVLAYGLDPLDYADVATVPECVLDEISPEARAGVDRMIDDLARDGIHSHSEIRQGALAQMLVDVARQYDAGLIVIGTEGCEGVGPVVAGAVAEQLVRRSPCPVLAVAEDWNLGPCRPIPGGPILLAIESNEATTAAFAVASSLAETFRRTLLVIHARRPDEVPAFLNSGATMLEEFGFQNKGAFPIRCIVQDGKPTEAISSAIELYQPSILVVGVKRTSESLGPHGTAFALLATSRVPVLCVPPAGSVIPEAVVVATEAAVR
jgi:nucleotide-binding universal stress UspA family protein